MKITQKCQYWDKYAHEGLLSLELEGKELEEFLALDPDEKDEYILENAEFLRASDEDLTINISNYLYPKKKKKDQRE